MSWGNQRRVCISLLLLLLPRRECWSLCCVLYLSWAVPASESLIFLTSLAFPSLRCRCWTSSLWKEARRTPSRGSSPFCQVGQGLQQDPGWFWQGRSSVGLGAHTHGGAHTDFSSHLLHHLSSSEFLACSVSFKISDLSAVGVKPPRISLNLQDC